MKIFKKNKFITIGLMSLLLVLLVVTGCSKPAPVELNVSAASSLTDALKAINKVYTEENDYVTIVANFASSGTLQKQIEQGAPADVFISAGTKQIQALQDGGLIISETRQNLLTNKVVLIIPKNSTLQITDFNGLVSDSVQKIAIGDPDSVPAGDYGKQALQQLGIWDQVQSKLILCTDVRQVLTYVDGGNVDAGIVYATDAAISTSVKVVADAPAEINSKIIYPLAVIKASKNTQAAKDYIAFLLGDEAKAIFEQYGFVVVSH